MPSNHTSLTSLKFAAVIGLTCLGGCVFDGKSDKPQGTEVENEVTGRLFYAGGEPAGGALVRLFPVDWDPAISGSEAPLNVTADGEGRYSVQATEGRYNIIGEAGGQSSLQDSVVVGKSGSKVPPDTLEAPGGLVGQVSVEPNHLLTGVTIDVLGTYLHVNVGLDGRFRLVDLPAGRYQLRAMSSQDGYAPLYVPISVHPGKTDTLADTLRLPFTGIPVVSGLTAMWDTGAGAARLAWLPTSYPLISEYAVFRDPRGAVSLAKDPIGFTADTTFADTLFRDVDGDTAAPWKRYEYRLRIRDMGADYGPAFGTVVVEAVSPALVRTRFAFTPAPATGYRVSVGDTLRIVAAYRNPTRNVDSLEWIPEKGGPALRASRRAGKEGFDSLDYTAPMAAGTAGLVIRARDASGAWRDSLMWIDVVEDRPQADAGPDSAAGYGSTFELKGVARQEFGSIVKWEWDIGGRGEYSHTSGPDTGFTLPTAPSDSQLVCVLRVTDDDGFTDTDTVRIMLSPSRLLPPVEYNMYATVAVLDGKIYSVGDFQRGTFFARDTVTLAREDLPDLSRPRQGMASVGMSGRLYVIGGATNVPVDWVDIYDPVTKTWTQGAPLAKAEIALVAAEMNGKIYAFLRSTVQEYDPASDRWSVVAHSDSNRIATQAVTVGDQIFLGRYPNAPDSLRAYRPGGQIREVALMPRGMPFAMTGVSGRLLVFGGLVEGSTEGTASVFAFRSATSDWEALPRTRYPYHGRKSGYGLGIGNNVYLLGALCEHKDKAPPYDWQFCPSEAYMPP